MGFFEKIYNIDKSLARLIKIKNKYVATDLTDIKWIIKDSYK